MRSPGPWNVSQFHLTDSIVTADGEQIAQVFEPRMGYTPMEAAEVRHANAALIAAAPDLLESCRSLVAHLQRIQPDLLTLNLAGIAIAKAEGRQ